MARSCTDTNVCDDRLQRLSWQQKTPLLAKFNGLHVAAESRTMRLPVIVFYWNRTKQSSVVLFFL